MSSDKNQACSKFEETEDDIPYMTERDVSDSKADCVESGRILQCFIKDLYRGEETKMPGSFRTYFKINNYVFRRVKIRGDVTNTKEYSTQTTIIVDDSTAAIECVFTKAYKGPETKQKFQKICDETSLSEATDPNDSMLAKVLLSKIQANVNAIPLATDIKPADKVDVIGDLCTCREGRRIYIVDISKVPKGDCDRYVRYNERTLLYRCVLDE